jgi:hypothetical protein
MARTLDMAVRRMEETNKQQTNSFNHRVDDMEDKIFQRLSRIEDKPTELQENVSDLHVRCETLAAQNDDLQRDVDFLKWKNYYMENQSRRNNLVFIGIPPSRNGSESWRDCEAKVHDVIYNGMYIEEDIQIERAHRVGKAVVAKFLSYRQKTLVLSHARDLKNTRDYSRVFVREDFSQPVREQRKKLAQLQRQLRQRGHNPKLRFDKLLDDGALYTVGADGQIMEQQRWARHGGGRSEYGAWSGDDGRAEGHQWSQGYDALGDDAPGAWNQDWGGGYDLRGDNAQWPRLEQRREGERGPSRQAGGTGGTSTLKAGGPQRLQYDGRRAAPGQHMQTDRKDLPSTAHSAPHGTNNTLPECTQQKQASKNTLHTHLHDVSQRNITQQTPGDIDQTGHVHDYDTQSDISDDDEMRVIDSYYAERDDSTHEEDDRQTDEDKDAREEVAKSRDDALVENDRDRPKNGGDQRDKGGYTHTDDTEDRLPHGNENFHRHNVDVHERTDGDRNRQQTGAVTRDGVHPRATVPGVAGASAHGSLGRENYNLRSRRHGAAADYGLRVSRENGQSRTPAGVMGSRAGGKGRGGRGRGKSPNAAAQPRIDAMFRQQPAPDPSQIPLPHSPPNMDVPLSPVHSDIREGSVGQEGDAGNDSDEGGEFEDATDLDSF